MSEGDVVAMNKQHKNGEASQTYRTRSCVVATKKISAHSQREASTSSMPPKEDEIDIHHLTGDIGDDI